MEERPTRQAIAWAAAWLALAALTAAIVGPWMDFYGSIGLELPWITSVALSAGEAMRGPIGWIAMTVLLVLGLLPLHLRVGGDDHRRWLLLGIAQAVVAALLFWASLELPTIRFSVMLDSEQPEPPPTHHEVLARSALVTGPGLILIACLQAAAWIPMTIRVAGLPRVRLQEEALRAIVVAVLPGAGLAWAAYVLVDDLRPGPSTVLLVDPPLAAAGTAALITYGGALWLRLRRASG